MLWSDLGIQFCFELAFGVLVALAFVPRAPVGFFFYRLMGSTAFLPVLLVAAGPWAEPSLAWSDPRVVCALAALVTYPVVAGRFNGRPWAVALALAIGLSGAGIVASVREVGLVGEGTGGLALASLSAMATGSVAGTVGLAMVLGHWYLTVPKLKVSHLVRLNRVTVACLFASVALLVLVCIVFREPLQDARVPLLGTWGLFYLGSRVGVGLLLPLVFAWMTAASLRVPNTRSATGILYASTVLVLIGTAISVALQDTYGVPL